MNKTYKKIFLLFTRYLTILALGLGNFYILQKIIEPLTINTSNLILSLFHETTLLGNTINFNQTSIEIIPSCLAISAFYLLIALILAIPMQPKTRTKAILTATISLFILNVARISFLASITSSQSFELVHWILWHAASTVFVVIIYISTIKLYKIKAIPIISDLKTIKSL